MDGVPGEIEANEIAILGELFTVHHFAVSRRPVLQWSDLRLVARLPGMPGDDAGSVQTNVVGICFLLGLVGGLLSGRETDHYGDGEAFFMTPFQISIKRHLDWTLRPAAGRRAGGSACGGTKPQSPLQKYWRTCEVSARVVGRLTEIMCLRAPPLNVPNKWDTTRRAARQ